MPGSNCARSCSLIHGVGGRRFLLEFLRALLLVATFPNLIRYLDFLGYHLRAFMPSYHSHGRCVLQWDNCSFHRSRLVTVLLDEYSCGLCVMDWPARSAVLNTLELFCDALEKDVKTRHNNTSDPYKIIDSSSRCLQVIAVKYFRKLVECMPCRVATIIKASAGPMRFKFAIINSMAVRCITNF